MNHRRDRGAINRDDTDRDESRRLCELLVPLPAREGVRVRLLSAIATPNNSSAQIARRHREFIAKRRRLERTRTAARNHHDRRPGWQMCPHHLPETLAHPPLHAIAHHRVANSARYRNPSRERSGSWLRLPAYSTKWGLWKRTPSRWRRKNSALRCSRSTAAKLKCARTAG